MIGSAVFAAFLLVFVSTILAYFALKNIKEDVRNEVGSSLSVVLDTTTAALQLWFDGQANQIQAAATTSGVSEAITTLLDPNASVASKAIMDEMLHTRLFELQRLQGHRGFDILSLDGVRILSTASADVQSSPAFMQQYPDLVDISVRAQVPTYIPPTLEQLRGAERVVSHFIVPVIANGETIAILASHHSPSAELTDIAQLGRLGESGETYLFNSDGLLITESRFNDDLIAANLISPDESSIYKVSISDPQINLTKGLVAPISRAQQPLTLMASQAIQGLSGQQLIGYRDYRGVDVIGVWTWLDYLSVGITVEIDLVEAMESYYSARTSIVTLLLLSISFALLLGTMIYLVSHRTTKLLRIAAKDLDKQVHLRTRELKQTADSLRNERELIRTVFDAVPDPIFCKTNNGGYFRVNKAFADLNGKDISDIEGKFDNQLYSEAEAKAFRLDDSEILSTNKPHTSERWIKHFDGRELLFETCKSIFNYNNDRGILAVSRDVTERKFTEEKLQLATENATKANTAKSEFLARMSHEIRTPMNGVIGMLELLNRSTLSQDQQQKINVAKSSAEGLLIVINDILDFSKIEAGKLHIEKVSFNVRQLIEESAQALAIKAESKDIELLVDVSQISQETIAGDPLRLRQVLTNLIGNAIKFTHQGEISVEASLSSENGCYILQCKVKDTGIGIPEDKRNGLFDSFSQVESTTTRNYGGTGLGLAISKRLVNLMGGEISVDSQVNKGSCFAFSIKLFHTKQQVKPIPEISLDEWNVLIVDDNQTNLDILSAHLENWGANVVTADHVDAALDILSINNPKYSEIEKPEFSLIITDMHMPEKDGLTLVQNVREYIDRDILPILMLSSISSQIATTDLSRLGLDGCLTKPVVTSDLFNAIALIATNAGKQQNRVFVSEHSLHGVQSNESIEIKWPDTTRILLVEDNHVNFMVAEGLLETIGLTCEHAMNGREAIEQLLKSDPDMPFTAVLMDCQMPVLDGYEATRQIRNGKAGDRYLHIPILAMTANALKGDREKCLAAGMDDHIPKPIVIDLLKNKLKTALNATEIAQFEPARTNNKTQQPESSSTQAAQSLIVPESVKSMDWQLAPPSIGEQPKLYLKSLEVYVQQYQDIDTHGEELKTLLHTIKGTSGNMGFIHLYELTKEMESVALEKPLNENQLKLWYRTIADSVEDAKTILKANQHFKTTIKSRSIEQVFSELITILERSELVPESLIEELECLPEDSIASDTKQQLKSALNLFDYDSALSMLRTENA